MKHFYILFFIVAKCYSQVSIVPYSAIPCTAIQSTANVNIFSGTSPYSYTVTTSGTCSNTYSGTTTATNAALTFSCPGSYSITVKDAGNVLIGNLTHTVVLSPGMNVNILPSPTGYDTICVGGNYTFYADLSAFNAGTGLTYTFSNLSWYGGVTASTMSLTVNPTATMTQAYFFSCLMTSSASRTCNIQGSDTVAIVNCTGIKEQNFVESKISLYPNPANDYLSFEVLFPAFNVENTKAVIYNSIGQVVKEEDLKPEHKIKVIDLPNGFYILKLTSQEKIRGQESFIISR